MTEHGRASPKPLRATAACHSPDNSPSPTQTPAVFWLDAKRAHDVQVIAKVEADSNPIIYIAVQAGSLSPLEASDYVKRYIQPRLSVLPGAADVRIFGERQVSMRINLDRTLEDVVEPYLIQQGFLQRTNRGRIATPLAYRHFGIVPPAAAGQLFSE